MFIHRNIIGIVSFWSKHPIDNQQTIASTCHKHPSTQPPIRNWQPINCWFANANHMNNNQSCKMHTRRRPTQHECAANYNNQQCSRNMTYAKVVFAFWIHNRQATIPQTHLHWSIICRQKQSLTPEKRESPQKPSQRSCPGPRSARSWPHETRWTWSALQV